MKMGRAGARASAARAWWLNAGWIALEVASARPRIAVSRSSMVTAGRGQSISGLIMGAG